MSGEKQAEDVADVSASYRDQLADQERFDALVAIRMERPGETRERAISWAANIVELMSPNAPAQPRREGGAE